MPFVLVKKQKLVNWICFKKDDLGPEDFSSPLLHALCLTHWTGCRSEVITHQNIGCEMEAPASQSKLQQKARPNIYFELKEENSFALFFNVKIKSKIGIISYFKTKL